MLSKPQVTKITFDFFWDAKEIGDCWHVTKYFSDGSESTETKSEYDSDFSITAALAWCSDHGYITSHTRNPKWTAYKDHSHARPTAIPLPIDWPIAQDTHTHQRRTNP